MYWNRLQMVATKSSSFGNRCTSYEIYLIIVLSRKAGFVVSFNLVLLFKQAFLCVPSRNRTRPKIN